MAPVLPALLCLGEMRRVRRSPGLEGPPGQPAPSGDPRARETPGVERHCSGLRATSHRVLSSRAECGPEDPGAGR